VDGGRREAKLNLLIKKSDIEIDQQNRGSIQKLVFKPKKGQSIKELDLKQIDRHNRPRQKLELLAPPKIDLLKNQNLKLNDTIGQYKNGNLKSTDCISRYKRKIKLVSEDRSFGPVAHHCL
jgi:hypothetical protein